MIYRDQHGNIINDDDGPTGAVVAWVAASVVFCTLIMLGCISREVWLAEIQRAVGAPVERASK